MPTYYARGVTVRLGVNSLASTITPNITLRKGDIAKQQAEKPEKEFLDSHLLPEQRVNFPSNGCGFELNWLGGAPFIQVQAGDNLFGDTTDDSTRCPATTVNPACLRSYSAIKSSYGHASSPLALSLHVKTSDMTFVSGLDKHNKLHLKIEVFFNGQLSSCLFLPPYEIRNGTKTHHQVFAGYRVDYLAERPWVMLPPQTAADGSPRKTRSSLLAEKRWEDIGKALSREADERGTDKHGNIPPTSAFLKALASLEMPDQDAGLQKPGCRSFGVVDVVITAGDGRKVTSGTTYLTRPQRFTDENFPMPISSPNSESIIAAAEQSNVSEAPVEGCDEDAEGDSESDYEPQPKRQALGSLLSAIHSDTSGVFSSLSREQLRDVQSNATPMSIQETSIRLLTLAKPLHSSSTTPSSRPTEVSQEPLLSPERGCTDDKDYDNNMGYHIPGQVPLGTPQSFCSFPSSNVGLLRAPQMRPSPYGFQFSDPVLGQKSPSGMMSLPSRNYAGFRSSSLQRIPQHIDGPSPSTFPSRPLHEGATSCHDPIQLPPTFEGQERRSSMDSAFTSTFAPAAIPLWHSAPIPRSQSHGPASSPSHVPNMLPHTRQIGHHDVLALGGLLLTLPHDRRPSVPLPPTGFYSVPVKPRSSLSPSKKPRPTNLRMPRRGFLLKRLIVTGKDGAKIVNYEWPIAQYVAVKEYQARRPNSGEAPASNTFVSSSKPVATSETLPRSHSSRGAAQTKVAPMKAPSQRRKSLYGLPTDANKGASEIGAANDRSTWSENSSGTRAESNENMNSAASRSSQMPTGRINTDARNTSQHLIPQRRTTSATNILGVQGPKAVTFLYDDPEVMIRGEKKAHRSKSPVKCKKILATTKPSAPAKVEATVPANIADDLSSPLSSLATTPEPGYELNINSNRFTPIVLSKMDVIAQIDGSPEPKPSLTKPTPSPTKLASTSNPLLLPKPVSTPRLYPSPIAKKRKNEMGRYLPKQPRSPDRLKTISNPPLNRDCVITFAESEDKESEMGVLRQVKSERQGVFAEEYVVFASRFYVTGN